VEPSQPLSFLLESGTFLAKKTLLPRGKNSLKKVENRTIEKRKIKK
jgi:hypothetical protein